ncbi:MAG: phosphoribosyltransferase family protein [Acidimicrobiales bacterium]
MLLRSDCALCDRPGPAVCSGCAAGLERARSLAPPLRLDACSALLHYGSARGLVTSLKNGGRRDLVGWLAAEMAVLLEPGPGAVVTWAPTGVQRVRARGFDQAELLARAVARRCDLPCHRLLRRVPGPPQVGRSGAQRRTGPAFRTRRECPRDVIVIDDVLTTGATVTAAARALREGGAKRVTAVVAARSCGPGRP